jgi:hypothetical protein
MRIFCHTTSHIRIYRAFMLFLPAVFLFGGCDKFDGDQTVPSYLRIDSLGFYSENDIQGSSSQKIIDARVYEDDDLIGGFELPAIIPILTEGTHKLEIRPGIMLNGIADTRAPYPCIKPIIITGFDFYIDSTVSAYGTTTYYDNAEFVWMEDFEDPSLAIQESSNSDTVIYRTAPANAPGAFIDDFSQYSGISYLDNAHKYVQLVSNDGNGEGFVFDRGDFVFLEMHYRNNVPIVVGLYIELMDQTIEERSFLVVNPTDEWNKIYINFTPIVNETTDAVNYKIYIEGYNSEGNDDAFIMLDNLKLVTRPNL